MSLKIEEMFAFVVIDDDGDEGIMAALVPGADMFIPLVGADMARVDSLRPLADRIKKHTGKPYVIKRFVLVEGKLQ